jgi:hypothetical protein
MIDKITIELLDKWKACKRREGEEYSDKNLRVLFGEKDYITPLEVVDLKIPIEDKIWVLLRQEVLGDQFMVPVNNAVSRAKKYADSTRFFERTDTTAVSRSVASCVEDAASSVIYATRTTRSAVCINALRHSFRAAHVHVYDSFSRVYDAYFCANNEYNEYKEDYIITCIAINNAMLASFCVVDADDAHVEDAAKDAYDAYAHAMDKIAKKNDVNASKHIAEIEAAINDAVEAHVDVHNVDTNEAATHAYSTVYCVVNAAEAANIANVGVSHLKAAIFCERKNQLDDIKKVLEHNEKTKTDLY